MKRWTTFLCRASVCHFGIFLWLATELHSNADCTVSAVFSPFPSTPPFWKLDSKTLSPTWTCLSYKLIKFSLDRLGIFFKFLLTVSILCSVPYSLKALQWRKSIKFFFKFMSFLLKKFLHDRFNLSLKKLWLIFIFMCKFWLILEIQEYFNLVKICVIFCQVFFSEPKVEQYDA